MRQIGIVPLLILAVLPFEPARSQSDSPSGTVQAPSRSTSTSNELSTIAAIQRVTNVMDRYPQVSRDDKILLFDSNRSGSWQIYRCTFDANRTKAADLTAPIYRTDNIVQLTKLPFPARCPSWSPDMKKIAFAGEPRSFRNLCHGC